MDYVLIKVLKKSVTPLGNFIHNLLPYMN
jgi:hypothetical protein